MPCRWDFLIEKNNFDKHNVSVRVTSEILIYFT